MSHQAGRRELRRVSVVTGLLGCATSALAWVSLFVWHQLYLAAFMFAVTFWWAAVARGNWRLAVPPPPRPSSCSHLKSVPVTLYTGETVAWLCPDCDAQLAADWVPEISARTMREVQRPVIVNTCPAGHVQPYPPVARFGGLICGPCEQERRVVEVRSRDYMQIRPSTCTCPIRQSLSTWCVAFTCLCGAYVRCHAGSALDRGRACNRCLDRARAAQPVSPATPPF